MGYLSMISASSSSTSTTERIRMRGNNKSYGALRVAAISVLTVAILLSQISLEAEAKFRGVNQFCKTSFWRMMCTKQVKGATNYEDAVKNCINSTIALNGSVQRTLPQVLSLFNGLPLVTKDAAGSTCQEDFNNMGDNLQEALGYSAQNDTGSVTSYLSSCNTNDCEEALKSSNLEFPPHVSRVLAVMHKYIDNCLAVATQK